MRHPDGRECWSPGVRASASHLERQRWRTHNYVYSYATSVKGAQRRKCWRPTNQRSTSHYSTGPRKATPCLTFPLPCCRWDNGADQWREFEVFIRDMVTILIFGRAYIDRKSKFLFQQFSTIIIQRGNAASFKGSFCMPCPFFSPFFNTFGNLVPRGGGTGDIYTQFFIHTVMNMLIERLYIDMLLHAWSSKRSCLTTVYNLHIWSHITIIHTITKTR